MLCKSFQTSARYALEGCRLWVASIGNMTLFGRATCDALQRTRRENTGLHTVRWRKGPRAGVLRSVTLGCRQRYARPLNACTPVLQDSNRGTKDELIRKIVAAACAPLDSDTNPLQGQEIMLKRMLQSSALSVLNETAPHEDPPVPLAASSTSGEAKLTDINITEGAL